MPDAHFTVPYPEHSHFVGREDDLARLHAALGGEGPVGINPAAMGNPTGVTVAPGTPPFVVTGDAAGGVYCLKWME